MSLRLEECVCPESSHTNTHSCYTQWWISLRSTWKGKNETFSSAAVRFLSVMRRGTRGDENRKTELSLEKTEIGERERERALEFRSPEVCPGQGPLLFSYSVF